MRALRKFLFTSFGLALVFTVLSPAWSKALSWTTPHLTANEEIKAELTIEKTQFIDGKVNRSSSPLEMHVLSIHGSKATLAFDEFGTSLDLTYDASRPAFFKDGKSLPQRTSVSLFYNPNLWGQLPSSLHVGEQWSVHVDPWYEGPEGNATTRISSIDMRRHDLVLVTDGTGAGPPLDPVSVSSTVDGRQIPTRIIYGKSTWHGRLELRDGLAVGDSFRVTTDVTLDRGASIPSSKTSSTTTETLTQSDP